MKKIVVLSSLVIFIGVLFSFQKPEVSVIINKPIVSQTDTIVDSTLYNSYMIHYKNNQTQVLQYPSDWNVYDMLDRKLSKKVVRIDTLQTNVLYEQLN